MDDWAKERLRIVEEAADQASFRFKDLEKWIITVEHSNRELVLILREVLLKISALHERIRALERLTS